MHNDYPAMDLALSTRWRRRHVIRSAHAMDRWIVPACTFLRPLTPGQRGLAEV